MKTTKIDISKIFSKIQKRCSKCEEYRDLEDGFYLKKDGKPSSGECKECAKDRARKYKQKPEVKKRDGKAKAKWYKENKKHCLNKTREWEKDHIKYTRLRMKINYYRKKIYDKLGKKITFKREYIKDYEKKLRLMKSRLENLKSIWHEFKVLAE